MGKFCTAQVCLNGHVATSAADRNPELKEQYCSQCGEPTLTKCNSCESPIRGDYHVDGVFSFGGVYLPPAFCHNCGEAFPWTERRIESAVELLQAGADLPSEELEQFRADLNELSKDGPRVQVAAIRFNKTMAKVGASLPSGVRTVIIDVVSEAAKKAIWG